MIKLFHLILTFFFLYTTLSFAYDLPDKYKTVVMFVDHDNQNRRILYNAIQEYGGELRYFIVPTARTVNINFNGQDIMVNLAKIINTAANYWTIVLGSERINFRIIEANNRNASNFVISAAPRQTRGNALAITEPYSNTQRFPRMQLFLSTISTGDYQDIFTVLNTTNNQDRLEIILYQTIVHEFGHALGVDHPFQEINDPIGTIGNLEEINVNNYLSNINYEVPIMTPRIVDYFRNLYSFYGRPITINDITVSNQEAAALRIAAVCQSSSSNSNSSRVKREASDDINVCTQIYIDLNPQAPIKPKPFSSNVVCNSAGAAFYNHIECSSADGGVSFFGNLGGLSIFSSTFTGDMYFEDNISKYQNILCSVTYKQGFIRFSLNIDCNGKKANMSGWGIGVAGYSVGTGGFR